MTTNKHQNTTEHYQSSIFQQFLGILSRSGILLMIATVVALIWANSPWRESYENLWHHTYFTIGFDGYQLHKHLIHWINDGLMAVFFFVVGLEIKREIIAGELRSPKKAALPLFAAVGGMVIPVLFFKFFGITGEGANGWGIPMATDIAFSIAILAMLGKKVPLSLKIFLTALAIVDDLGAVMVIALFYTSTINWTLLIVALGLLSLLFILNRLNIQNLWFYTGIGFVIWILFLYSGIHATIAGVLIAFTIPIYPKVKFSEFAAKIDFEINKILGHSKPTTHILDESQMDAVDSIQHTVTKVQSPLQRIEHDLEKIVNLGILPLFALANAGVAFGGNGAADAANAPLFTTLGIAIAVALVFGKAIGISLFAWLAVKLKMADLPQGTKWLHILGVGFLGGIGFTMSLFITTLAYSSPNLVNEAKIGIFAGSLIAGILGFFLLKIVLKTKQAA